MFAGISILSKLHPLKAPLPIDVMLFKCTPSLKTSTGRFVQQLNPFNSVKLMLCGHLTWVRSKLSENAFSPILCRLSGNLID